MSKNIGKPVQALYYIDQALNENTHRLFTEKMERGINKYNDISVFDNSNNRLIEIEVKSSITETVTNRQIWEAASQILASALLNKDLMSTSKFIISLTDSKMTDADIFNYLRRSFLDIKSNAEIYTTNKLKGTGIVPPNVKMSDLSILISKLQIFRMKKDETRRGDSWYREYKESVKDKFSKSFTSFWNKSSVKEVFEELYGVVSHGLSDKVWMNKGFLGKIVISRKVFGIGLLVSTSDWIDRSAAFTDDEGDYLIEYINSGKYKHDGRVYRRLELLIENSDGYEDLETRKEKQLFINNIIKEKNITKETDEIIRLSMWGADNAN